MGDVSENIRTLMLQHAASLTLYARQFFSGGDFHAAEEVVQDVFFRLTLQKDTHKNLVPWLYLSVRNGAISKQRSCRRRKNREDARPVVSFFEQDVGAQLDAKMVTEKLQSLDQELREIVTLHLWGELSFAEIGELLGKSKTTVFRRYEEALETLRAFLDRTEGKSS